MVFVRLEELNVVSHMYLHVGNFLEVALLKEREEGLGDPVNSHDVDCEALLEILPNHK